MKKSLLALAVLGAFAGAASAQTNVTIYGLVDAGIEYTRVKQGGDSESTIGLNSGLNGGSRLGFKGSEDLGGGLKAIFTLENGFNADDGTLGESNTLFNRQAWVGLQGNFGAVKFGRQYTPMFVAVDSVDPFGTNLAGSLLSTFETYDLRMNNTVNYSLPSMGGFYGEVAYGFGEQPGDTTANRQFGLNAGYANGPLNVVAAYHNAKDITGNLSDRTWMIGGTYDLNVAKVHVAFANDRFDDVGGDEKWRNYMVGVSAPVGGAGKVMASFQRADARDSDDKIDVLAVGYTHNLSKRTHVYTALGFGKEEEAGVDDIKTRTLQIGLHHKF